jgi:hypothetical protein
MLEEIAKLEQLRALELPPELFAGVPRSTFIGNVRWLKSPTNCADILLHRV